MRLNLGKSSYIKKNDVRAFYLLKNTCKMTPTRQVFSQKRFFLKRQQLPAWLLPLISAILLRMPLFLLPGAGRDESLYFYWAFHPEPAYSPLMQMIIRMFSALPLPPLMSLRMSSLLAGIMVLLLFDQLLKQTGNDYRSRVAVLSILAFSPWQSYVGAILHPDNLLLAIILFYLVLMFRKQYLLAAFISGLALWVKPSGILMFPIAMYGFLFNKTVNRNQAFGYIAVAAGTILPIIFAFNKDLLLAISEFGRIDQSISIWQALFLQFGTVFLLGGPLLLIAAIKGLKKYLHNFPTVFEALFFDENLLKQRLILITVLVVFGAFAGAALIFGQIKGNWMLPSLVLLSTQSDIYPRQRFFKWGLIFTVLMSIGLIVAMLYPQTLKSFEAKNPLLGKSYSLQAGSREAKVSATSTWAERVTEYQSLAAFADNVQRQWESINGNAFPGCIISDDYGLAAQLAFTWKQPNIRLIIVDDGIFKHRLPTENQAALSGGAVILGVLRDCKHVYPQIKLLPTVLRLKHPYANTKISLGFNVGE